MMAYDRATYNAGGEAVGTRSLWNLINRTFDGSKFLGIYNNRLVRGSADTLSLHAEGRAVDFIPPSGKRDEIASWALANAGKLGIQEIIVYETKRIWTASRPNEGFRPYNGVSAGLHHIHIGQNREAARIAGGHFDALTMASTTIDIFEELGFRTWQVALLVAASATVVAVNTGLSKRIIR